MSRIEEGAKSHFVPIFGVNALPLLLLVPSTKNSTPEWYCVISVRAYSRKTSQYILSVENDRRMKNAPVLRKASPIPIIPWKSVNRIYTSITRSHYTNNSCCHLSYPCLLQWPLKQRKKKMLS